MTRVGEYPSVSGRRQGPLAGGPEQTPKVCARRNLQAAFWAVWRNEGAPGVDGQTVRQFDEHSKAELARLGEELKHQRDRRQPARRVWIP